MNGATPFAAAGRARRSRDERDARGASSALSVVRDDDDGDAGASLRVLLVRTTATGRRASTSARRAGGGGADTPPVFHLTGGVAVPPQPPANPYALAAGGATIVGAPGQFQIRPGEEVRVGGPSRAVPVLLQEPRVSGVHATLKFESAAPLVRDESSNNGTYVDGARIAPGVWMPVPGVLRFGPIDFSVRLDA